MSETSSTTERIIAAAERRMRTGGFHGFSFREIAADVGVRSASVHHHFPTKEDLAAAVARAYTDRFKAALGDPADPARSPQELLLLYVDLFRRDLVEDRSMCLCGFLACEGPTLAQRINAEIRAFFADNLAWLERVLARADPQAPPEARMAEASRIVATLEGALLLAHSLGDRGAFEGVAARLVETLPPAVADAGSALSPAARPRPSPSGRLR